MDLLVLRRGPQDMPSDWGLLAGLALVYCGLGVVQVRLVADIGPALAQAGLATLILAAYVNAVLRFRERPARCVQTLSALLATGSVLTVLMLGPTSALAPFLTAIAENPQASAAAPQPPALAMLAYMLLGLWGLVIFGHIYRHALDVGKWLGIGAAIGFEVVLLMCLALLGQGSG